MIILSVMMILVNKTMATTLSINDMKIFKQGMLKYILQREIQGVYLPEGHADFKSPNQNKALHNIKGITNNYAFNKETKVSNISKKSILYRKNRPFKFHNPFLSSFGTLILQKKFKTSNSRRVFRYGK